MNVAVRFSESFKKGYSKITGTFLNIAVRFCECY